MLSDLRESGSIEQDADVVLLTYFGLDWAVALASPEGFFKRAIPSRL